MKTELIHSLTSTFEGHAQQTEGGTEYWLARDLQYLLGYTKWDNFLSVVSKARTACELSGHEIKNHFADVGKMVDLGSRSQNVPRRTVRYGHSDQVGFRHSSGSWNPSQSTTWHQAFAGVTACSEHPYTSFPYQRQPINSAAIDQMMVTGYRNKHIRPLAVRPPDHPERWPTPWGFLFSRYRRAHIAPPQRRLR